jgi:hypothetical protein
LKRYDSFVFILLPEFLRTSSLKWRPVMIRFRQL